MYGNKIWQLCLLYIRHKKYNTIPIARYLENNNSRKENAKYMHYIAFSLCFC